MTKINSEIVADSINQQGDRLVSVLCTFPRIILAEVNTHRMLSKNTSSSRAIPFQKMLDSVQKDPFIPYAFQKNHSGMQGSEYIENPVSIQRRVDQWLYARDLAILSAKKLYEPLSEYEIEQDQDVLWEYQESVTKQLCNRILEPFMWTTMLLTGSMEGWNNFFNLRNPSYEIDLDKLEGLKD